MTTMHTISEVSVRTGIPKDLLRQWERRYGYPDPQRDNNGDRIYTTRQLDKLSLIRQLLDQGKRPGKLVELETAELQAMLKVPDAIFDHDELITLLKTGKVAELDTWLLSMVQNNLRGFVHRVMAPATRAVGDAWAAGELTVHEEHLYTEIMKRIARKYLAEQPRDYSGPRVMLTTVPGEKHTLGLLMVEIIMRLGGAEVIAFGTEMPFNEIREAAEKHQVDIIGLSFSGSFRSEDALVMLSGLRQAIRPGIRIWAGGAAFNNPEQKTEGVEILTELRQVENVLAGWK
jgi:MerR family transcriptional regulator, light-induced transcriptional regulator